MKHQAPWAQWTMGSRLIPNQVHVEPEFIRHKRQQLKANNDCCTKCGDMHSQCAEFRALLDKYQGSFMIHPRGKKQMLCIPKEYVARTDFTMKVLTGIQDFEEDIEVKLDKICGLHQRRSCLYRQDCKSMHICRDLWRLFLEHHTWLQTATQGHKHLVSKPDRATRSGKPLGQGKARLLGQALKLKAGREQESGKPQPQPRPSLTSKLEATAYSKLQGKAGKGTNEEDIGQNGNLSQWFRAPV